MQSGRVDSGRAPHSSRLPIAPDSQELPKLASMLPLASRRILITRPHGQSSELASALELLGATPILIPTIEIAPPTSFCALDAAITALRSYDFLIFTSANAVESFAARAHRLNLPPHPKRIAAIGPATAAAIHQAGLRPDQPEILIPPQFTAESLAGTLLPFAPGAHAPARMLLVRAAVAPNILPAALAAAGANLTIAEAYRTVIPPASIAELRTLFTTAPPDAITFTSASTAQNLAALLESAALTIPPATVLASIGPITSAAMCALDIHPTVEAEAATIPSLAAALVQSLAVHFVGHP